MGTAIVLVILAAVVALAVRSIWKRRKSGGCSCGCPGCNKKSCH